MLFSSVFVVWHDLYLGKKLFTCTCFIPHLQVVSRTHVSHPCFIPSLKKTIKREGERERERGEGEGEGEAGNDRDAGCAHGSTKSSR